jgi:hypothetical protein
MQVTFRRAHNDRIIKRGTPQKEIDDLTNTDRKSCGGQPGCGQGFIILWLVGTPQDRRFLD